MESTKVGHGGIGEYWPLQFVVINHLPLLQSLFLNSCSDNQQRGCVTPRQLEGLHDVLEGDVDMLDGNEELPDDCQEKVKRALKNGHVDDEDWRGVRFPSQCLNPLLTGVNLPGRRAKPSRDERVSLTS